MLLTQEIWGWEVDCTQFMLIFNRLRTDFIQYLIGVCEDQCEIILSFIEQGQSNGLLYLFNLKKKIKQLFSLLLLISTRNDVLKYSFQVLMLSALFLSWYVCLSHISTAYILADVTCLTGPRTQLIHHRSGQLYRNCRPALCLPWHSNTNNLTLKIGPYLRQTRPWTYFKTFSPLQTQSNFPQGFHRIIQLWLLWCLLISVYGSQREDFE